MISCQGVIRSSDQTGSTPLEGSSSHPVIRSFDRTGSTGQVRPDRFDRTGSVSQDNRLYNLKNYRVIDF